MFLLNFKQSKKKKIIFKNKFSKSNIHKYTHTHNQTHVCPHIDKVFFFKLTTTSFKKKSNIINVALRFQRV